MAARESSTEQLANRCRVRSHAARERVQRLAVASDDRAHLLTWNVEYRLVAANAHPPECRKELRAVDRPRVQQPIPTSGVRGDRERVSRGIRQLDVRMMLYAQVAARGRLTVERRREHAMLDRHPFRTAVQKDVERLAVPRPNELRQFVHRQFDRADNASRAQPKQFSRGVRVEDVHRVIGGHVSTVPPQLGHETEMTAEHGELEVEPFLEAPPFFRPHDRRGPQPERDAPAGERLAQRTKPREWWRRMTEKWIETHLRRAGLRGRFSIFEAIHLRREREPRLT